MVIARAVITNNDKSRRLTLSLDLILKDKSGIELFEDDYYYDFVVYPGYSEEVTHDFYVPTGLVGDIKKLSTHASYSFRE